ncbi:MAG: Asp-tRNA(Asn)/Glu-tRNA(Gln) amidotransferase subunit GatA [Candidatus Diapherotrites archaeon]|uniref:Asp-tRNA(Asn)/Glu-tRNA(Gln) amidotransferase subunit GatA n=1 Tax=Candidatus Iainarchaeum sp. TaxID=3101447 RepID=A0A8T3YL69_9ARCH|nr:Asp-tRNA(Asn)/Glu-tRNA(Gln) amidotransferase subunit GatA [Candidatus Diapherotrites archaeon]
MKKEISPVVEFVAKIQNGGISALEHAHKICDEIEKKNKKFHHFNSFDRKSVIAQAGALEKEIKKGRKGKLLGVPVSVKDCICVKGVESRAGSRILSGYRPVFDATAVARAREEGAIILGKTAQDEFGFGTFSVNHMAHTIEGDKTGGVKIPLNPLDPQRSCGGSSGGAAGFSALTEYTHIAIGESTGGSIACPASFCGVASITPTYGAVSRYGLMDYANSLDKIGAIGKSVPDVALLMGVIAGKDVRDSTSADSPGFEAGSVSGMRIGVPKELMAAIGDGKLKGVALEKLRRAEELGCTLVDVSMPMNAAYGVAVYYLIAMAEASTNLAKYCGMRYGHSRKLEGGFNEYFSSVRSEAFGEEAKRRILLGTFARMSGFRDAYYLRAMKARTRLISEFMAVLGKVDVVAHPAMPVVAPRFSEIERLTPMENYAMDLCTVPANLCGLPHATINAGLMGGLPVGLMFTAGHFKDSTAVSVAAALEAVP